MNATDAQSLIATIFTFNDIESVPPAALIDLLMYADDFYFNDDQPPIEDNQYDAIKQYAQRQLPAHVYFTGVGSAVRGGKVALPHQMGSLNQTHIGELTKWYQSTKIVDQNIVISDKLDGASCLLILGGGKLQIAYSRGDGIQGADITRHMQRSHSIPKTVPTTETIVVRAENIISVLNFNQAQTRLKSRSGRPYANPRNMVSGLMNASSNDEYVYTIVDTIAYEIVGSTLSKSDQLNRLKQLGFNVVPWIQRNSSDLTEADLTALLNERRSKSNYELDGLVLDVDSADERKRLHNSDVLNQAYATKYKVADSSNQAYPLVTGVTWAISKDGYYKPTIQIEPTQLCGVTIQNCTGFNAKFILENGIGPGAKISLVRSGDVIPFCQQVLAPAPDGAQMPDDDDAIWTETGVDLVVADVNNNETAKYQRLVDFFNTIDIPHLGEGNIKQMFDVGFDTPESIITLTQEDLCSLLGSTSIGKKIYQGMRTKFNGIQLYTLMGAHPCFGRGVGVRKMKKLFEALKGNIDLFTTENILKVDGFEAKTAKKVVQGIEPFKQFLDDVKGFVTIASFEAPVEGIWTGKSIVITGFRDSSVDKLIESKGGKVGSGVSSKTYLVVAADPSESSTKLDKARDLGIQIVSKQQFLDAYGSAK